jgi:hypothetical protein
MLALTHADEKANANSALNKHPQFILQGSAPARCCCDAERQQSPSLLRRRLGCCSAKLMLVITHADEKANANSALNKHPQNSSYKVQLLYAAAALQSSSNRLRSISADLVAVLQNSCWSSCTPTKKQTRIQRLAAKTQPHNKTKLTSLSIFTRLISPVVMRAANATQSASETPQPLASISSLSTSNSLRPNFTVGMEHADADVPRTLLPEKLRFIVTFCSACGGGEDNSRHQILPRIM